MKDIFKVPTYITWGYNDDVCPPTTSYAAYNVLQGPQGSSDYSD